MKSSFKLSNLLKYEDNESPTKRRSVVIQKSLRTSIAEITQSVFQFTIQEFTQSIKKERVPIQKNLLKKIYQYVNECQIDDNLDKKIQQKIIEDQNLLVFALCHISKPIIDFLDNHFIDYAEQLQITIQEINLQLFQPKIVELIKTYIANSMSISPDSLYYQILEQSNQLICNLSYEVSDQICLILEECKGYIEQFISKFRERSIPQILLNKYTILALFQELSQNCYQTIQDLLEFTIFHYAEPDVIDKFMRYAIENYDTLILKNKIISTQNNDYIKKQSIAEVFDCLQQCITNKNKSIAIYKIQCRYRSKLQIEDDDQCTLSTINKQQQQLLGNGLYLEGEEPQTKFVIYTQNDEYKVIYAPLVSKRWAFIKSFVIDQQEKEGFFKKDSNRKSGWGVYPVKFKNMKELLQSNWIQEQLGALKIDQGEDMYIKSRKVEGEMDTMFGQFLVNVSRSREFLQNFGENAVNNGCMQQLVVYMPLLKDFLNLGGFGAQALLISQEIYMPQRTFTSTLAISTSLVSGAIIGQALIPIPLVGGIVGGIIGGYFANKGMTNYTKSRNEKKSQEVIQKLLINQQQDGHWECNKGNLDILVINFKILNDYMPKSLNDDQDKQCKWLNLVIFGILSLFFNNQEWEECVENLLKYIQIEKLLIADTLENLKQIVEVIVKNL